MPRFFVGSDSIDGESLRICGGDAFHIARAQRMAVGDSLTVCDDRGREYDCVLSSVHDSEVLCRIRGVRETTAEPSVRIRLFAAWSKGDKPEIITQKAVELGASSVTMFSSGFCVVKLTPEKLAHRTERLRRIAEEAAKQCGRGKLPQVCEPLSYEKMLREAAASPLSLFCYEGEHARSVKEVLEAADDRTDEISVIVGSEGGFSPAEAAMAVEAGLVPVHLGRRILRCETAPDLALSAILYRFDL